MKIKVLCLLSVAALSFNSCALLLGTGDSSGSVKEEVTLISSHSEERKKSVELKCSASSYDETFLTIYLVNCTNDRIYIEWENARCDNGKVVFGDDRRITMNNPKADEAVSSLSMSLRRDVTSADRIGSNYILPLFRIKLLKEGLSDNVTLKIPIRFMDGSVEEYTFNVKLSWETTPNK